MDASPSRQNPGSKQQAHVILSKPQPPIKHQTHPPKVVDRIANDVLPVVRQSGLAGEWRPGAAEAVVMRMAGEGEGVPPHPNPHTT